MGVRRGGEWGLCSRQNNICRDPRVGENFLLRGQKGGLCAWSCDRWGACFSEVKSERWEEARSCKNLEAVVACGFILSLGSF